ncbi:inovirus-type Gp2 protein [Erwinia sp. 9145]|uniref:rolling circle replication-associated protein n=1 Tax=Erwinia sp. 9145 TaxID=1500895 RepID=UPI000690C123|nr:inovirus-type Gp2 protein [Erwinia sp. 9145]
MKRPYNANPKYEMDDLLLTDINMHMEAMFQRFAKLLPFRIDFAYKKSSASFGHACKHSMYNEVLILIKEFGKHLPIVGYYWVIEYTKRKGLHVHFVCYLNGQFQNCHYPISRAMGDIWKQVTDNDGCHHLCVPKDIYEVKIGKVIRHFDTDEIDDLRYVISYLAKCEQKENGIIAGKSEIPVKSNRGRPRIR